MKKSGAKILVGLFVLSAVLHAFGVAAGSCLKNAIALKASQSVTLVDEYDPEFKEYYGSGVRYYKVTLRKGQEYTIWINGGSAAELQLDVDVDWSLEEFPSAWFNYVDFANGVRAAYMYADSWSDDDPASFTYYVAISGEIGQQTMLYASQGIMSFTQVGEEGNPKRLAISDTQVNDSASLIEGDYFYIATLEAGRKYMFRTTGGAAGNKLGLSIEPAGDWMQEDIREYTNDVNNRGVQRKRVGAELQAQVQVVSHAVTGQPSKYKTSRGRWLCRDHRSGSDRCRYGLLRRRDRRVALSRQVACG